MCVGSRLPPTVGVSSVVSNFVTLAKLLAVVHYFDEGDEGRKHFSLKERRGSWREKEEKEKEKRC